MKKILIIEDDDSICTGLKFYMKKRGISVSTCANVFEAKQVIIKEFFDIIIMDVGLPDGDGFELAKYIRTFSQVPIIFLTAVDGQDNIYKGFELGGDDYVTKPFSIKELFLRVNSILKRQEISELKKVRTSGDIILDNLSVRVHKKDKSLELTPTEFKLINLFFDNPKKALSRDDILKNIWDTNEELKGDNTISVYIKRLREKIEDEVGFPEYIKTVRNVGYMWDKDVE